jgi:hypothetical protein
MAIICSGCGQPILASEGGIAWNDHYYHHGHVPATMPPAPENRAVLRALRLIESRAKGNAREEITLGDIEWAIQEIEK